MTELTAMLLAALLSLVPRVPQPQRGRMASRHDAIVAQATASAERYGVPVALLLSTAFLESHIGTDSGEASWGAPINRRHRHTAGTSDNAASSLALGFRRCGTWTGAVHHFRAGRCHAPHLIGYQPTTAIRLAEQVLTRAGQPLPDRWR